MSSNPRNHMDYGCEDWRPLNSRPRLIMAVRRSRSLWARA